MIQRGERLSVRRLGPPRLGAAVVLDQDVSRRQMNGFQNVLAGYLGEEHLAWVLRRLGVNCVIDVGANNGQFGHRLRRSGFLGRIVSFEPVPAVLTQLREAADGDHDWQVWDCALGDRPGPASINVVPGTMSSLLPTSEFGENWRDHLGEPAVESIQVKRLTDVFDEVTDGLAAPRVFLKLDTQGYDLAAFRGAEGCLDRIVGLQSELACVPLYDGMPLLIEALTAYQEAGFELSGLFRVSGHRRTLRAIEFDAILVRPDAVRPD